MSKKLAAVCPATDPIDQPAILKWSILMDTQGSLRKLSMSSKKTPKPYYYCPAGCKIDGNRFRFTMSEVREHLIQCHGFIAGTKLGTLRFPVMKFVQARLLRREPLQKTIVDWGGS